MCKKLMYLVCFVLVLGPVLMDSYAEASLIDGVVAYWPFDGNADDSAGDNHGVLVGNASYVDGKLGKAAKPFRPVLSAPQKTMFYSIRPATGLTATGRLLHGYMCTIRISALLSTDILATLAQTKPIA